jgi:hypothetical protein
VRADLLRARTNRVVMLRGLGRHADALVEVTALVDEAERAAATAEAGRELRRAALTARALRASTLLEMEQTVEAVAEYTQLIAGLDALAADGGGPPAQVVALSARYRRATATFRLSHFGDTIDEATRVIDELTELAAEDVADPHGDLPAALDLRGRACVAIGRNVDGLADFARALELGEAYAMAGRPVDLPALLATRAARARTFATLGRNEEALVDETAVVEGYRLLAAAHAEFRPPLSAALRRRSVVLVGLGRVSEAAVDLAEAERSAAEG